MNPSLYLNFVSYVLSSASAVAAASSALPHLATGAAMRRARWAAATASVGVVVQAARTAAVALGLFA